MFLNTLSCSTVGGGKDEVCSLVSDRRVSSPEAEPPIQMQIETVEESAPDLPSEDPKDEQVEIEDTEKDVRRPEVSS